MGVGADGVGKGEVSSNPPLQGTLTAFAPLSAKRNPALEGIALIPDQEAMIHK